MISENTYLDVVEHPENTDVEHDENVTPVVFSAEKSETAGSWFIKKFSDNSYYIFLNNNDKQTLTAGDNGKICLSSLEPDNKRQIWQCLPLR